jgi:hypothetical protein
MASFDLAGREPGADFTDLDFGRRLPSIAIAPHTKKGASSRLRGTEEDEGVCKLR